MARSLVDRLLAGVGLQRVSMDVGGFRGARSGRLSHAFEAERRHINSAVAAGGDMLRARSRFHTREGGLLLAGKDTWVAYAVGTGIQPTWPTLKPKVRQALSTWFNRWAKSCDFDGRTTYYGLQAQAEREVFEAGEVFVRLIRSTDRPLELQLICSEQLPYECTPAGQLAAGHDIRLGIEFDQRGKRVAYHFYRDHPGDGTKMTTASNMMRVPAEEILHLYRVEQPGQLRGLPQTRAALVPANKLDDYDNSALERANVGTGFAVFIKREQSDDRPATTGEDGPTGDPEINIAPGSVIEGAPGEEVQTISPPDPGNNYDAFTFRQSTRVTAAMGVPYAETTGDLRRANYSSTRAGRQPFRRRVEQRQQFEIIPGFCDPVVLAALADALLRGDVVLPRGASRALTAYDNIDHIPQLWEYVDPRGDAEADIMLMDNLLKARSDIAAERGEDAIELDEKIQRDQARARKMGLEKGGKAAAAAPTPAVDPPEDQPEGDDTDDRSRKDDDA